MADDTPGAVMDMPEDVVDPLLWRNARRTLAVHRDSGDGSCWQCLAAWPCAGYRLAQRAADAARAPRRPEGVPPSPGPHSGDADRFATRRRGGHAPAANQAVALGGEA